MKWQRMSLVGAALCALMLCVSAAPAQTAEAGPAPDNSTAKYEIDFMTGMIDHHMMAVQMAEICLKKALHEELIAMCQDIIATQTQEIQQMQTWLMEW